MLTLKNVKTRHYVLPDERKYHYNILGKGIGPESNQTSGSSWPFAGNAEDTEIR